MGRRWGKTLAAGVTAILGGNAGEPVAWIVPTYKNARPVWRFVEQHCRPMHKRTLEIHIADRVVEWRNGGYLAVYSADNDTSIRGERFGRVRIDEAARIKEETYTDVIEPTVADLNGEIWNISTPHGRNWFWRVYMRGLEAMERNPRDSFEASWRAPTSANLNPNIQRAYQRAKDVLPPRSFAQEWDAEFVDDGNGLFPNYEQLAIARLQTQRIPSHQYVVSVDWGKWEDFTVINVIDVNLREQCYLERFNMRSYDYAWSRLRYILATFRPLITVPERNSMGEPMVDSMRRLPFVGNLMPFYTSNITKSIMVETLSLAFNQRNIKILRDSQQRLELEAFESARTPSGLITYRAPSGSHDDCVMSLGIGWQVVAEALGFSLGTLYTGTQRQAS